MTTTHPVDTADLSHLLDFVSRLWNRAHCLPAHIVRDLEKAVTVVRRIEVGFLAATPTREFARAAAVAAAFVKCVSTLPRFTFLRQDCDESRVGTLIAPDEDTALRVLLAEHPGSCWKFHVREDVYF